MRPAIPLLLIAYGVSGCDKDVARTEATILARRAAIERPELWSVRAAGQVGPTVRICTSQALRTGFIRPAPSLGGQTCRRLGAAVRTIHGWAFRCSLGGDTYAVSSAAVGDLARAFETQVSITPLQGRGRGFHQTLRYARLGACPAGWTVGQAADRRHERRDAVAPLDDAPSP